MDKQRWMVVCGVAAIVIYTLSWIMQLAEIPHHGWVRLAAIAPFLVGLGILLNDRRLKAKARDPKEKSKSGWEDILGEDEES